MTATYGVKSGIKTRDFELCYTLKMSIDRASWQDWAQFLHHHDLQRPVALFLEAAGPLNLLMAQLIYLGSPLLTTGRLTGQLQNFAELLEDPSEARNFAAYLKEENYK